MQIINEAIEILEKYLLYGEKEEPNIHELFCEYNFIEILMIFSESKIKQINLQIIKTLSILINNITNKTIFYYLMSNNFINNIISNNYFIKQDNDYLLIYVNFLKIVASKLNQTTLQFLFREEINSFPLIENAIKLYNHPDIKVRKIIKNIFLITIKMDYKPLNKYLCNLPIVSYFSFIACYIKDKIMYLSHEIEYTKNNKQYNNKFKIILNDIIDNLIYIQNIFDADYPKINYIITNCMFYYCINPFILYNLNINKEEKKEEHNNNNKKLKKSICIFFINLLLLYIKNDTFVNILFTLIFFPLLTNSINKFMVNEPIQPDNYYYDWNQGIKKTSSSFLNYIQYNFNSLFLKSFIYKNNSKYTQIQQIYMKYQKILNNDFNFDFNKNKEKYLKEIIKDVLNKLTCSEISIMSSYHNYLSIGTGVNCGLSTKNTKSCVIQKMGKYYMKYFNKNNQDIINKMIKNNIKDNLFELLKENKKDKNILLINILLKNILNKNNYISRMLLRESNIIPGDMLKDEEISYIINLNKERSFTFKNKKQDESINRINNIYNNYSIDDNFVIEDTNKENQNQNNINAQYFETDIFKNLKVSNMLISIDEIVLSSRNNTTQKLTKKLKNIDNNCDIDETIKNNKEKKEEFIIQNKSIEVILPKNKYSPFDNEYFNNIEKNLLLSYSDNNKDLYEHYYNEELLDILIKLLDINSDIKIITIKIVIDNILSLITAEKYNNYINNNNKIINQCFISQNDKNKIFSIYQKYKNDMINNYNNKKSFHNNAYKMFIKQYDKYIKLNNINYDDIINEGLILLPENLQIIESDNNTTGILDKYENKYERNIIIFLLIHDFYYKIISYEKCMYNENEIENIGNNLYINNFPLIKRKTLELNKQYTLIDLDSNIKYYNCMCKIIINKNSDNSEFFYSYLLIYDNFLYIGDSSNNISHTLIKYKYLISSSSIKAENFNNKNITIYILDDISKQNYIEIYLDFKDYNTSKSIKSLIEQEMKKSLLFEKGKIKDFFESLK